MEALAERRQTHVSTSLAIDKPETAVPTSAVPISVVQKASRNPLSSDNSAKGAFCDRAHQSRKMPCVTAEMPLSRSGTEAHTTIILRGLCTHARARVPIV
jgi:hypothetical protein